MSGWHPLVDRRRFVTPEPGKTGQRERGRRRRRGRLSHRGIASEDTINNSFGIAFFKVNKLQHGIKVLGRGREGGRGGKKTLSGLHFRTY